MNDKTIKLEIFKERFENNMKRHAEIEWQVIQKWLEKDNENFSNLVKMEETGGEPDVIIFNNKELYFVDFSKESPIGRRSLCYDERALNSRRSAQPKSSVESEINKMRISLLNECEYKEIQDIESLDLKSSSWLQTPKEIRDLGGALFGDCRYKRVFIYHNGAESYYSSRGFRGKLKILI